MRCSWSQVCTRGAVWLPCGRSRSSSQRVSRANHIVTGRVSKTPGTGYGSYSQARAYNNEILKPGKPETTKRIETRTKSLFPSFLPLIKHRLALFASCPGMTSSRLHLGMALTQAKRGPTCPQASRPFCSLRLVLCPIAAVQEPACLLFGARSLLQKGISSSRVFSPHLKSDSKEQALIPLPTHDAVTRQVLLGLDHLAR